MRALALLAVVAALAVAIPVVGCGVLPRPSNLLAAPVVRAVAFNQVTWSAPTVAPIDIRRPGRTNPDST